MASSVEEFLGELSRLGLLEASRLAVYRAGKSTEVKNARECATDLVEQQAITQFQADIILAGQSEQLRVDDYEILDRLGKGGMGEVYRAVHRVMHRQVALKVIDPRHLADQGISRRFEREITTIAQMSHRNIVTAFDAGVSNGRHYLVMELVEGVNLRDRLITSGPLPQSEAMTVLRQALAGLAYAHERGVVHRDIKPANLMVGEDTELKILDLGLARLLDPGDETCSVQGQLAGTLGYMAPEQATGSAIDHRADIFALGRTWRDLLVGSTPDNAADDALRRTLPPELFSVYAKMTSARAEDRYSSALAVVAALDFADDSDNLEFADSNDLLPPHVAGAFDVPTATPAPAGKRSLGMPLAVVGAGLLIALLAAVYFGVTSRAFDPIDVDSSTTLVEHIDGEPTFVLFSPDASLTLSGGWDGQLVICDAKDGQITWTEPKPKEHLDGDSLFGLASCVLLDSGRLVVVGCSDGSLRAWDLRKQRLWNGREAIHAHETGIDGSPTTDVYLLKLSERRVASGGDDGLVHVWDFSSETATRIATFGTDQAPKDRHAVYGLAQIRKSTVAIAGDGVQLWDIETNSVSSILDPGDSVGRLKYAPAENTLFCARVGGLIALDVVQMTERFRIKLPHREQADSDWGGGPLSLACSPEGEHVVTGGEDGVIAVWSAANGELVQRFTVGTFADEDSDVLFDDINGLAFSGNGRWLVAACMDGTVRRWRRRSR